MAPSHPSAVDLKDGMDDEWMDDVSMAFSV
jgi:hypothetical protein